MTDLVPGSLLGYRSWNLDTKTGFLNGMFSQEPWQDGVNQGTCQANNVGARGLANIWNIITANNLPIFGFSAGEIGELINSHDDQVPLKACSCGFYAYWSFRELDGNGFYTPPNQILLHGVVEATGKTLIGTAGFRCAKARIKAIVLPPPARSFVGNFLYRMTIRQIKSRYPDVEIVQSYQELTEKYPVRFPAELISNTSHLSHWTAAELNIPNPEETP